MQDGRFAALDRSPWLKLELDAARLAGRWVEMTYASGLTDPLARPVLRCFVGAAYHDSILPAALHGRASWLGRIPDGTDRLWISPTCFPGGFAFRLESLRPISHGMILGELLRVSPQRGVKCLWARALGHRQFAHLQIRRALCAAPIETYDRWRKAQLRPYDPSGFDRDGAGGLREPHFRFVLRDGDADLLSLRAGLAAQPNKNWSIVRLVAPDEAIAKAKLSNELFLNSDAAFAALAQGLSDEDFLVPLTPGDRLAPYALPALARAARENPQAQALYSDEDRCDAAGRFADPQLRPDWSPVLASAMPYWGATLAITRQAAARLGAKHGTLEASSIFHLSSLKGLEFRQAFHIRRVLVTRSATNQPIAAPAQTPPAKITPARHAGPRASLIIPTRDRLDLIKRCIDSHANVTQGQDHEILIADNDSADPQTLAYLKALALKPHCRVIHLPGPFNFAHICNQAAREATSPYLVFLNNDVEIIQADWLDRLLELAQRPEIGVVGAKLLYRDRRVQHAGVILGIDGRAAHFQRLFGAEDPGFFHRLDAPHEIGAVTAACMAVEARKFWAVDGFDATNLPVEYNDIDLCLRLSERGWKTLLEPRAMLIHDETASRGANALLDGRYRRQHEYFVGRWAAALRDDPYFHPALSLDSLDAALG